MATTTGIAATCRTVAATLLAGVVLWSLPASTLAQSDNAFAFPKPTARFLTQATFGPTPADLRELPGTSASDWFIHQLTIPASTLSSVVADAEARASADDDFNIYLWTATTTGFWRHAIAGEDQLRQRMAFALSQILVVSNAGGGVLGELPAAMASYQDILIEGAFGNYRDLLEAVTYSPAMGDYLTYLGSEKGDPETGRMPDENYARELLQLFTIGLVALNPDGSPRLDNDGNPIETYSNADVTGLARVFTGFRLNAAPFEDAAKGELKDEKLSADRDPWEIAFTLPMEIDADRHSEREKTFLGTTIAAGTPGDTSVSLALDHIFAHPNLGPFISRQLIQRFVASNPPPAYIERVAQVFERGEYALPNGQIVGTGERGDLAATLASVLFDAYARSFAPANGGKVREPVIRFANWARAFDVATVTPEYVGSLWDTSGADALFQHPYRSPSVFNFYRPGYVAPGTLTAERGLVAPELQLVNATSVPGYANFISWFATNGRADRDLKDLAREAEELGVDPEVLAASFIAPYTREEALASHANSLINHLDLLLTYGTLSTQTRIIIRDALQSLQPDQREDRIHLAVTMMLTSPDFLVQR